MKYTFKRIKLKKKLLIILECLFLTIFFIITKNNNVLFNYIKDKENKEYTIKIPIWKDCSKIKTDVIRNDFVYYDISNEIDVAKNEFLSLQETNIHHKIYLLSID